MCTEVKVSFLQKDRLMKKVLSLALLVVVSTLSHVKAAYSPSDYATMVAVGGVMFGAGYMVESDKIENEHIKSGVKALALGGGLPMLMRSISGKGLTDGLKNDLIDTALGVGAYYANDPAGKLIEKVPGFSGLYGDFSGTRSSGERKEIAGYGKFMRMLGLMALGQWAVEKAGLKS